MSKDVQSASARVVAICGADHEAPQADRATWSEARDRVAGALGIVAAAIERGCFHLDPNVSTAIAALLDDAGARFDRHYGASADDCAEYRLCLDGAGALARRGARDGLCEEGLRDAEVLLLVHLLDRLDDATACATGLVSREAA
jgi:hypothetical protein